MILSGALALLLFAQAGSIHAAPAAGSSTGPANVEVVELRVDGRAGELLGIDNPQPTLGWQMVETSHARQHRCYRANVPFPCPGDAQTGYQIQVGSSSEFVAGQLLWDSGKVASDQQISVVYEGQELQSRQRAYWRVRVWDADGRASEWSEPGSWEMGLLSQSDWGEARWIDHAGRQPQQPLPIFARSFDVDGNKTIERARLYLSGVGLHRATINGLSLTDEVFAPGDSNYQLSNEYRTYDVEPVLQDGENVIGVKLGHGTAYVRRELTGGVEVPSFGDMALELDVTVVNAAAGVFFRADTAGNAYMWQLNNTGGNPRLRPHLRVGGGYTLLDEIPLADVLENGLDQPNRLTITAVGDQITTAINGVVVDVRTDDRHAAGTIGFRTAGQENGRFDNVVVTEGGEVSFSEDFSGPNPFSGGTIVNGELQVSGGTDALLVTSLNPGAGRTSPYAWWQSQLKGSGTLVVDAPAGATNVRLSSVANYHVGGTINIDTGDGGDRLESRAITAIGTAGAGGTGISFEPPLDAAHAAGALVTASGNNIAATDPSAGAAVTPRLIGRLEVSYTDGTTDVVVTDRSWRSALGPYVTDAWFAGADFDARRVQEGWDEPGADLSPGAVRRNSATVGWKSAGLAPPPNLATELVARAAEGVVVVDEFKPKSITNPQPGVWVFDFGQNFAGVPQLRLKGPVTAGVTVRMHPAESLDANGTVNNNSIRGGGAARGTQIFNSYTTYGDPQGETWHPDFNYFGMQWVQVDGLPEGYVPDEDTIVGLQTMANVPVAGSVTTSNDRINRIHRMIRYSIMSNMMSTFTDCPGREKLSYPADYTMPMGMVHRNFDLTAYMRTTMHHLVEGQSIADTFMRGNVALKAPVFDWGYTGNFGDEINWGNGIVLVPWFLYEYYDDTQTMSMYYDEMKEFVNYIRREKTGSGPTEHIVNGALADWASAQNTSGQITGTWGYYITIDRMAKMAALTGHDADAAEYEQLAEDIRDAFNTRFYNDSLGRYTAAGNAGTAGATQAAQALALDAGLVPEDKRETVLDALVELIYGYQPFGGGPHFSAGTIGMASVVRALMEGDRDDVLWDVLQEDTQPSYGFFMAPTTQNPDGFTTIGERWTRGDSKNHIILAQIEEWFHSGLAGIRKAEGSIAYRELVVQPKIVGDLSFVEGSYETPQGTVTSSWTLEGGRFELAVTIPSNTTAEVWVPTQGDLAVATPAGASFERIDGDYAVYEVGAGSYAFVALDESWADLTDSLAALAAAGAVSAPAHASLQGQLDRALETARDGRPTAAANQLQAFANAVEAQVDGSGDNANEKARLLSTADSLIAELMLAEAKRTLS